MYHDILLPTDGSALSRSAVEGGIQLARQVGARVHGCYVVPLLPADALDSMLHMEPDLAERQAALFERIGDSYLAHVAEAARWGFLGLRPPPGSNPGIRRAFSAATLLLSC